jgi:co-chaperonin GroES (HSP10)
MTLCGTKGNKTMTELELQRKAKIEKEEHIQEQAQIELDANLPHPVGYKILIALIRVEETFDEGTILKATKTVRDEYILSTAGMVLELGPQAYTDKELYPTGPWCKPGDYVMFRANTGTRFKIGNQEYRLMNDDSVEATVPNPKAIVRA